MAAGDTGNRQAVTGIRNAVVLVAAGAIAGALLGGPWLWLHYLCKPLATLLILSLAARAAPWSSSRQGRAVVVGMGFSLAGDVFLMLPQDLFLPGLLAFLLAHLCFIVAFYPGASWSARLCATVVYAIVAAANLALLLPKVPPPLRVPVLAYVGVLLLMAAFAAARAWGLRHAPALAQPARVAALGGALFVLSDSLLAWDRFAGGLPLAPLLVLASYYGALWCIAWSLAKASPRLPV